MSLTRLSLLCLCLFGAVAITSFFGGPKRASVESSVAAPPVPSMMERLSAYALEMKMHAKKMTVEGDPFASCDLIEPVGVGSGFPERNFDATSSSSKWRAPCAPVLCNKGEACSSKPIRSVSEDFIPLRVDSAQPCCSDLLDLLLVEVLDVLSQHNVAAFAVMGSLLGAARDGKHMPWTADIDIAVTYLPAVLTPHVLATMRKRSLIADIAGNMGRICFHRNRPGLRPFLNPAMVAQNSLDFESIRLIGDFWEVLLHPTTLHVGLGSKEARTMFGCVFPFDMLFPLTLIENFSFGNFSVLAPNNVGGVLERRYGLDWMKPPKTRNPHGGAWNQCLGKKVNQTALKKWVQTGVRPRADLWLKKISAKRWKQCYFEKKAINDEPQHEKRFLDEFYIN